MTLSIIIVNYNVREFLEQAILSIQQALRTFTHEIWVVDNASTDGSAAFIRKKFPHVRLFENSENAGFARANNQAIAQATGDVICLINPDTIVQEDTFSVLIDFLARSPDVAMVGCKVLNADGSLQAACRRSFPTPWIAFTKIVGLSTLFPSSRLFGRYNLTFLDPDQIAEVEAISGSFMMVRRSVVEQIGGLDEDFFMYGEDLDWCYRIRQAGYKIIYVPTTQIIHFKGESSKKSPLQQRRLFYEAMHLFVLKHFKKRSALAPSWFLILAIYVSAAISVAAAIVRKLIWPFIDFIIFTCSLAIAIALRFHPEFPWAPFILVHSVYSLVWLSSLAAHGLYTKYFLSGAKAASGVLVGWLINSALTFFFKQYGFSRAVVLTAGVMNLILLPSWRFFFKWIIHRRLTGWTNAFSSYLLHRRSLIVGDAVTSEKIIHRLRSDANNRYQVEGVVLLDDSLLEDQIAGVPVVGFLEDLPEIIRRERAQEVIFSTDRLSYDKMLAAVANSMGSQINFKMVPSDLQVVIGKSTIDYINDIPFVDLEYRLHQGFYQKVKRLLDIVYALILMAVSTPLVVYHMWIRKTAVIETVVQIEKNASKRFRFFDIRSFWRFTPLLIHVLRGEISMVGREIMKTQDDELPPVALTLKPGLTGLEQLNKAADMGNDERCRLQLFYLKNYSPLLDLEIIFKTLFNRKS
ncbi:MAG: glycosyltransferase [Calditrichaeota bacterium]|nr:MAG: glycosyltransferase [Calditrichota bacterium]